MKRAIIIAIFGSASTLASNAQGVFFSNYQSSTQNTGVTFASGPLAGQGVGSEFQAILLFGPANSSTIGSLAPIGSPLTFVTSLGYPALAGGAPLGGGTAAGSFGTSTINFPAYGTTYSVAIEATGTYNSVSYTGYSQIIQYTTKANATVPTGFLPVTLSAGSFTVAPVPEPTTLALAGLGGLASLVMLRRKNA